MDTQIAYVNARTARARLVDGVLHVRMPRQWPADFQAKTIAKFERWGRKQLELASTLPPISAWDGQEWTPEAFVRHVRSLNDETLRVPLKGVRIGEAKRTRLAQANTRTGVLTFSRYAINGMPERALRYLILHELAHLLEANHSSRFWRLVERFEPDYKRQRAIAQAHHARMVESTPPPSPVSAPVEPDQHPFGPLFSFLPPA
ncbi:MAG TPA: YgjP-like metallopeptidase domain-containing protein [Oscillatoriaceae cyanobacterium]